MNYISFLEGIQKRYWITINMAFLYSSEGFFFSFDLTSCHNFIGCKVGLKSKFFTMEKSLNFSSLITWFSKLGHSRIWLYIPSLLWLQPKISLTKPLLSTPYLNINLNTQYLSQINFYKKQTLAEILVFLTCPEHWQKI